LDQSSRLKYRSIDHFNRPDRFIKRKYTVSMARTKQRSPRKRRTAKRVRRRRTSRRTRTKRSSPPMTAQTTIRAPKRAKTTKSSSAHHQVIRRPFSSATTQPKIPDGEFTHSLSRRLQNVTSFTNANAISTGDTLHVVFAPTLGVPLTIFGSVDGKTKRGTSTYYPQFVGFPGQTVGLEAFNITAGSATWPPASATDIYTFTNAGAFAKWRIVSQALRMELVNSDEENDGWWEACRFSWSPRAGHIELTSIDGGTTSSALGAAFGEDWLADIGIPMAMVEQPGYKTGLLRDLKKIEFPLHHQSTTHEPVQINEIMQSIGNTDHTYKSSTVTAKLSATSAIGNQMMDQYIDKDMDLIYLRLHCRTNNGSSSAGSKFMLNMIQNVEVNFAPTSDFAAFQTPNVHDKQTSKVLDSQNNVPDAGGNRRK
jgi:hypothetical protein